MTDLNQFKNLIIDMDGVLWRGNTAQPGLTTFFDTLRALDINFILATNNATRTPEQHVAKLAGFGVTLDPEQILTSSLATAAYLNGEYPAGATVYVVGDSGLRQALLDEGFTLLNPAAANGRADGLPPGFAETDLVIVGLYRDVCYRDLAEATVLLNRGARFIGTNPDVTFPSEWGPLPGAGSLLALLQTATGIEPTIVGKPGPIIFGEALRRLGSDGADTAMVGDRLETDIAGGRAAGLHTILLLSGISKSADLTGSEIQPDFVFDDISELTQRLAERAKS